MAVYRQIENHLQFAIASGRIRAGQALPSVRQLSDALEVNPNTVTKALRDLEIKGLVTTVRGIGVKVAPNAKLQCRKSVQEMVRSHLRNVVGECVAAGLTSAQIRKLVADTLRTGHQPYGA
jgi:GntR family transcriptional regulator